MGTLPATTPTVVVATTDRDFEVSDATRLLAEASRTESTRRAYESDMRAFATWAESEGRLWLPATPETVCEFIRWSAERHTAATIQRRLSSISQAHKALGLDSPTATEAVRRVHKGTRKTIGTMPPNKKGALTSADVAAYFQGLNGDLRHLRDKTLLTWGLSGAFRRSELVALEVGDLEEIDEGYKVLVRRSKTDQEGQGAWKAVVYGQHPETDPVRLMREWLTRAGISSGPIFRPINRGGRVGESALSGRSVADVVKRVAVALGKDPNAFSGHSLRRGFITEAARAGASEREIAKQSHHKSYAVLRGYVEESQIADTDNAVHRLGL